MAMDTVATLDHYYWGLGSRRGPKLLARSSRTPWKLQERTDPIDYTFVNVVPKLAFVVAAHHPLREKLATGLRDNIRDVLSTMKPCKWITVDYLRLGYDEVQENNPVVVAVTVEEDQVPPAEAQRIVDALSVELRRSDLHDVEAEVMEGPRTIAQEERRSWNIDELRQPVQYPLIGDSIGISRKYGLNVDFGSLGGYVSVDGRVMALTTHHVAFGSRVDAFPTEEEVSKVVSYTFHQPAEADIERQMLDLEWWHEYYVEMNEKGKLNKGMEAKMSDIMIKLLRLRACTTNLGNVWKSSGLSSKDGNLPGQDWALIGLENIQRFPEPEKLVNKIPYPTLPEEFGPAPTSPKWLGADKYMKSIPSHLKGSITMKDLRAKQIDKNKENTIVFKTGTLSRQTYGILASIDSDYRSENGVISTEVLVINDNNTHYSQSFSADGDEGSFVWDTKGHVCGLLRRGKSRSVTSYMTPIEYVFEDIRKVCNAKEVKLVVRKEDKNTDDEK